MNKQFTLLFLLISNLAFNQNLKYNKILDEFIDKGMDDWKIPGASVLIVQDQQVVYHKSFGLRDINNKDEVNGKTLFTMASTTKAITAMCLGILVDQEKIKWTDRVVDHFPEFKLADPYVTSQATIEDLLTHRIGFHGVASLYSSLSDTTREAVYQKFSKMEQKFPFRSSWEYSNQMYGIAGHVIYKVSGIPYADFVKQKIFDPLGMNHSIVRFNDLMKVENKVKPHDYDSKDSLFIVDYNELDNLDAAGAIWSCTDDLVNYLKFLNANGEFDGKRIISENTFEYLFSPKVTMTAKQFSYPVTNLRKVNFMTYGLGWFQHDYEGLKVDMHTGSLHGLISILGTIREKKVSVYFFGNLDHAEFRHAFLYKALDLYGLNNTKSEWGDEVLNYSRPKEISRKKNYEKYRENRKEGTQPAHDLKEYCGRYVNENLGSMEVTEKDGKLHVKFNQLESMGLSHWNYETFKGDGTLFWGGYHPHITFINGNDGKIWQLRSIGEVWNKN